MPLQPRTTLGPYTVTAKIDEGSMRRDWGGMSTDRHTECL
jgi:hypothetical protein